MFEKYDEKARRSIFFARYEAGQFGAPEIESEHLLLGLMRADQGPFNLVLGRSLPDDEIRAAIVEVVTQHSKTSTSVDLPFTNECKRILAYAAEEAMRLSQNHIGTEHILLGLLREEQCLAAQILRKQGLELKSARTLISTAKGQLAASGPMSGSVIGGGVGQGSTKSPPIQIQIVETGNAELRLHYPNRSMVPRIGELIRIRDADDSVQSYRVQDVVWELAPDQGNPGFTQLKEAKIYVFQEKPE